MRKIVALATALSVAFTTSAHARCGQGDLIGKWKIYSNSTAGATTRCNFEIDNTRGHFVRDTECLRLEAVLKVEKMKISGGFLWLNVKCELAGVINLQGASPRRIIDIVISDASGVPSAPTMFGMGNEHVGVGEKIKVNPATYILHRVRF